jgi:hypothetical protein
MLFPSGWSLRGDWPDLAASAAPAPLLIHYLLDDAQFTVAGMRGGRMRGSPCTTARLEQQKPIVANFILGPHRFDAEMQQTAFSWLKGIYYNALAPGYFRTELNKALVEDEKFPRGSPPGGRLAAGATCKSSSARRSFSRRMLRAFVNGHVLYVVDCEERGHAAVRGDF